MELQRLYSYARKAIDDYSLIEEGDKIAVGISGGKDSSVAAAICAYALGKDRSGRCPQGRAWSVILYKINKKRREISAAFFVFALT